ncbi:hypothetical protein [Spartinivicinus poritis]|uniref:Uncharacterized protein n=1 Tax=Spartinivicinus poritis TaxID=2994640 RepID=A0ABT5UI67_9GAMM|nr:hypothetical protein [Spartinivicinus sp. A2-2]MDE1466056.1 hypothetical protein [Spartinivicinus sp. A2-2]
MFKEIVGLFLGLLFDVNQLGDWLVVRALKEPLYKYYRWLVRDGLVVQDAETKLFYRAA